MHTLTSGSIADEIAFIVNDADDSVVLVDESLLPLWAQIAPHTRVARAIVLNATGPVPPGFLDYETLLGEAEPIESSPSLTKRAAAAMCYTTG